jgi:cell division protease FtsH
MNQLIELIERKQKELDEVSRKLKGDFIGLDAVIDQVIESIKVWYIFPELQIRPTIISLWGLTGVGKTDLIRKMVSYMNVQDRFLEIEMNGVNDSGLTVQKRLDESSIAAEEHCILFLDEFQKFRTVDDDGSVNENNTAYADVWTLLSDGKFHSDLSKKTEVMEELLYAKYYGDVRRVEGEDKEKPRPANKAKKKKKMERIYHTPVYLARKVKRLFKLEDSLEEIMKWDDDRIFQLYDSLARNPQIYEGETYKKMLIIIAGNLDEAYKMASDVEEADMDADFYHEISKKLTVLDIKAALEKRFRPEQIARFGNTHVLYPSLSKKNFHKIIVMKCDQINKLVFESKGIAIRYDQSVYDAMYNNGVFPTQGVRPLLSTITNILSSALPSFIFTCLLKEVMAIDVSVVKNKMFTIIGGKRVEVEIPTVLDNLRDKTDVDTRNVVAVHELGHAIVYAVLFGVPPKQICTDSVSPYNNGFVLQHTLRENKDTMIKQIQMCLAGRVAEEVVFGHQMASIGAAKDFEQATQWAWAYVGRNAFDGYVGYITQKTNDNDFEIYNREEIGKKTESILQDAKNAAADILNEHLDMFKEMLRLLMKNGKLNRIEFGAIASAHGIPLKDVPDGELLILGYEGLLKKFLSGTKTT